MIESMYRIMIYGSMLCNHGRKGRVPFSLGAVIALLISVGLAGYIINIDTERSSNVIKTPVEDMDYVSRNIQEDIILQAYYIAIESIRNVTEPTRLNPSAQENFTKFLETYPKKVDGYLVEIISHEYYIIFDLKSTIDHVTCHSVKSPSELCETGRATYFRLVGNVVYRLIHPASGRVLERNALFDKNIYSPYPLLKGSIDRMQANSIGELNSVGRTLKYILTTITQLRVLEGLGGGAYGSTARTSISDLLTEGDIEKGLMLSLLIEEARDFRDYDREIARQIGAEQVLNNYLTNGTIDGADVFLLFKNCQLDKVDIGKVIGQAIYSYLDKFLFDMYCKIWGDLSSSVYIDPTLSEPLRSFEVTKTLEVIDEGLAKQCLIRWFYNILDWLGFNAGEIGHDVPSYENMVNLGSIRQHFLGCDTVEGGDVEGIYELFSGGSWVIHTDYIPSIELMILGEDTDPAYRPIPYSVTYYDDGWSGLGERSVNYYLVKKSFISMHWKTGSDTPYRDALMYIIEGLDRSMRAKSGIVSDKGLLDMMATKGSESPAMVGLPEIRTILGDASNPDSIMYPKNNLTVISNGTVLIVEEMEDAVEDFKTNADLNRERWWSEGAYKEGREGFIWSLFKESIELIYEAISTLESSALEIETFDMSPIVLNQEKVTNTTVFNFRKDAMKDIYERVYSVVEDRISEFDAAYWTNISGHPEHSSPPVCPTVWDVYYRTGYSSPSEHLWNDINNMVERALDDTFGNGVSSGLAGYLYGYLDSINGCTDSRAYSDNFYDFVTHTVGLGDLFISDDGDIMNLARYWLTESLDVMLRRILDNVELCNIEYLDNTSVGVPYEFWAGKKEDAQLNKSMMFETARVKHRGFRFDVIEIADPSFGDSYRLKLADVQDNNWNISKSAFQSYWRINLSAELDLSAWTERSSLVGKNSHVKTYANETIKIEFSMPIVAFSAWNLDDLNYPYTRGYLGVNASDTPWEPFFVSRNITVLMENATEIAEVSLEGVTRIAMVSAPIMSELYEKRHFIPAYIDDTVRGFVRSLKEVDIDLVRKETIRNEFEYISDKSVTILGDIETFQLPMLGIADCEYNLSEYEIGISDEFDFRLNIYNLPHVSLTGILRFCNFEGEMQVSPNEEQQFFLLGVFEIYGQRYQYSLVSPMDYETDSLVSTYSRLGSHFSNVYLPYLGTCADVNVVVFGKMSSSLRTKVETAFEVARNKIGDTPEHLISFTRTMLGNLVDLARANPNSKTINTTRLGISFEVNFTNNYDISGLGKSAKKVSYGLVLEDVTEINGTTVSEFLEWVINNLRTIIYSIGKVNDATTPLSSLPWRVYQNSNARIHTFLEFFEISSSTIAQMNIPATMQTLPFACSDFDYISILEHKRIYYSEFGRCSEGRWSSKGSIFSI